MTGLIRLRDDEIDEWADRIRPHIARACERSRGRYEARHILQFAKDGDWQVWLFIDARGIAAVCGTEIVQYPTGVKAIGIRFGTGRNREKWQHHMEDVVAWGKERGCTIAEGPMRKGWRRVLPNWFHTHDHLERTL